MLIHSLLARSAVKIDRDFRLEHRVQNVKILGLALWPPLAAWPYTRLRVD
jgi:hypothetical protein